MTQRQRSPIELFTFAKVDGVPPKRGSRYVALVEELKQMPNQWVRLENRHKRATDAGSIVAHLNGYYKVQATARTPDGEVYHVYVRYVPEVAAPPQDGDQS